MTPELINFGMEPVSPSIIMVAGVGGGGSNAVNHMFDLGIAQVTFMICNTDKQALSRSPVPIKVKLGETLTEGLGAGNNPERGRNAALESLDEVTNIFRREGTKMVFITAGMGGGTGTGAAPVIARAAREMGILTVGIVTLPFKAEGKVRASHAVDGIEQMRGHVDALLVINNENIQEIYGKLPLTEAFGKADDILATAAKGIAEVITREGVVNVDFADVNTVMKDSGIALMGSGRASGEHRAQEVADLSLRSPLLNHNNIEGAKNILLNISSGQEEITMEEMYGIVEYIQQRSGNGANIIWGAGSNPALGKDIEVTIIATGFDIDEAAILNTNRPSAVSHVPFTHRPTVTPATEEAAADAPPVAVPHSQPRTRWEPPKAEPHPFEQQQQRAAAPPAFTPPATDTGFTAFTPQPTPPAANVIAVEPPADKFGDLKQITEVPAFMRRKVQFVTDTPTPKEKKAVIRDDSAATPPPAEGSLFD